MLLKKYLQHYLNHTSQNNTDTLLNLYAADIFIPRSSDQSAHFITVHLSYKAQKYPTGTRNVGVLSSCHCHKSGYLY